MSCHHDIYCTNWTCVLASCITLTKQRVSFTCSPGGHPTNGILLKFEIWAKFGVLYYKMGSTDHNKILHTSWLWYCCDMLKTSLWSAIYAMKKSITKFHWIWNLIKILLVGWVPGLTWVHCRVRISASSAIMWQDSAGSLPVNYCWNTLNKHAIACLQVWDMGPFVSV